MTKEDAIRWLEDIHRRFNPTRENLENEGGDVHLQALDMAIEALSADAVPQLKQTDTLILADALRYLAKDTERHLVDRTRADALRQQFLKYGASMCKGGAE